MGWDVLTSKMRVGSRGPVWHTSSHRPRVWNNVSNDYHDDDDDGGDDDDVGDYNYDDGVHPTTVPASEICFPEFSISIQRQCFPIKS